jgi:hypothetical protein
MVTHDMPAFINDLRRGAPLSTRSDVRCSAGVRRGEKGIIFI